MAILWRQTNTSLYLAGKTQWAPLLDSHDPDPPIPLENMATRHFDGILLSQAATILGVVSVKVGITGSLLSQSATMAGTVSARVGVSGTLLSQSASMTGTVSVIIRMNGILVSSEAIISGRLVPPLRGPPKPGMDVTRRWLGPNNWQVRVR